jgi:hypothetical protein
MARLREPSVILDYERDTLEQCERIQGARVGSLLGVNPDGSPLVAYEGCPSAWLPARWAVTGTADLEQLATAQAPVVLVFENGDATQPIVVGVVQQPAPKKARRGKKTDAQRHVHLEAEEELTIRCGKGAITIRADGKILIHGSNVTSRATQTNRIKGGAVRIN